MSTVTKRQLTDGIVRETGAKRSTVRQIVQAVFDTIIQELSQGNRLEFRDFGVFEVKQRRPRMAQNPRTLERVNVPAKKSVKFKPGQVMKDKIQGNADGAVVPETRTEVMRETETPTMPMMPPQVDNLGNAPAPSS